MINLTVGKSGNEDFYYIEEALNAVPYNEEAIITIKEGIYREKLFSDKKNLTLRGEGEVIITNGDYGKEMLEEGRKRGTFRSYTAFFSGERLTLENLTIENTAGAGRAIGQAVALYLDVAYSTLNSVRLLSHQDTLFLSPLPPAEREKGGFFGPRVFTKRRPTKTIFKNGYIEGTIDFIFGSGDALFLDSEIKSVGNGYVTAPSTRENGIGFVFSNCHFTSNGETDSVYLMRPWREYGRTTIVGSIIDAHVNPSLACPWPEREDEFKLSTFNLFSNEFKGEYKLDNAHILASSDVARLIDYFTE